MTDNSSFLRIDHIMKRFGETIAVNDVSLDIERGEIFALLGAEIDYKEDLQGAQFVIKNPNATTTCGCGSSFST